ncbi:MAG TPA: dinitrogenase iron-molybdenum cofactor biosynthesis protein [Verrucomicrobia bacterium]|nr:dinitrogenase iron-molybdenum cofactor biosynthesis protein [Verrucomicrobiota bacterium]HOP98714.1 NifB/NifX family molybdenum-iron cluster-binding protein [Verrucomicrobiota bacterium]
MKIAIPIENGRLHGHFGGCREFALVEVDAEQKLALRTETVSAPEHQPGLFPRWLRELGVQVVIAGGIGRRALANFAHHGIVVRAGTANTAIEPLVAAYLSGQLTVTPEGCDHHGHHHDHEHHHHHHNHVEPGEDSH